MIRKVKGNYSTSTMMQNPSIILSEEVLGGPTSIIQQIYTELTIGQDMADRNMMKS